MCFRHMFGNVVGESKLSNKRIGPWRFDDSILPFIIWLVLSDEQISKRWPFSLLNNEQRVVTGGLSTFQLWEAYDSLLL